MSESQRHATVVGVANIQDNVGNWTVLVGRRPEECRYVRKGLSAVLFLHILFRRGFSSVLSQDKQVHSWVQVPRLTRRQKTQSPEAKKKKRWKKTKHQQKIEIAVLYIFIYGGILIAFKDRIRIISEEKKAEK